jgi:hypothetical protein
MITVLFFDGGISTQCHFRPGGCAISVLRTCYKYVSRQPAMIIVFNLMAAFPLNAISVPVGVPQSSFCVPVLQLRIPSARHDYSIII